MLVAENADGAAVLIQIQLQIIGIDLWVCARRNGDRMRGFIGSDGICLLYCSRTGDIMLARGSIGIARIYQFTRQRIPLELESMRLVVLPSSVTDFMPHALGMIVVGWLFTALIIKAYPPESCSDFL